MIKTLATKFKSIDVSTLATVIAGLAALSGLVLVLNNLNKGLDWFDEAWAIGLMSTNHVTVGEPWGFQHVMQPLWFLFGQSVIGARFGRFVLYELSTVIAALAVIRFSGLLHIDLLKIQKIGIFIAAQSASLMAWAYWTRTFGYNEFGSFLATTCASLLVFLLARPKESRFEKIKSGLIASSIGLVLVLAFFTKATTGALLAACTAASVIFFGKKFWVYSIEIGLGAAVGFLYIFAVDFPITEYFNSILLFSKDVAYAASYGHPNSLVRSHVLAIAYQIISFLPFAAVSAWVLNHAIPRKNPQLGVTVGNSVEHKLAWFVLIGSILTQSWYVLTSLGTLEPNSILICIAIYFGFAAFQFVAWSDENSFELKTHTKFTAYFLALVIFLVPYLSSFGTNNVLNIHITFNSTIWGAVFGLGVVTLGARILKSKWKIIVIIGLLPLYSLLVLKTQIDDFSTPYGGAPSYTTQTTRINSQNPLNGLYVDKVSANFAEWLEIQGRSYKQTPVISVENPGTQLAFNGNGFASYWLSSNGPGTFGTLARKCNGVAPTELAVLLPSNYPEGSANYSLLVQNLKEGCKIDFPKDFKNVATSPGNFYGNTTTIWILNKK